MSGKNPRLDSAMQRARQVELKHKSEFTFPGESEQFFVYAFNILHAIEEFGGSMERSDEILEDLFQDYWMPRMHEMVLRPKFEAEQKLIDAALRDFRNEQNEK